MGKISNKKQKPKRRQNESIVFYIDIFLLILAGITIASLTNSGLFSKSRESQDRHEYAAAKEIIDIKLHEIYVACVMDKKDFNMENTAIEMTNDNNITIDEKYFNATGSLKTGVSDSIVNLKGIVVSANQYERFKFLVSGKNGGIQITGYTTESVPNTWTTGDLPTGFIAIGESKQATPPGAPTLEMFVASYNETHSNSETATSLGVSTHTIAYDVESNTSTGYKVGLDGGALYTYINGLGNTSNLDKAIYCPYSGYWWLASPSDKGSDSVMRVEYASGGYLSYRDYTYDYDVRPLVSIQISKIGNGITITSNYFNN